MRTYWILLNLVLSVFLFSIVIIFIGCFDAKKIYTGKLSKIWAKWIVWISGIDYEIDGLDYINKNSKYIIMCNHQSAFDILLGFALLPLNIIFLAKKELFYIPIFGWAMKASGMIEINRQNPEVAIKSVDAAVDILISSSLSTIIYPEGTRSNNGELLQFKKGGFILAIRTQLPVVPITIIDAYKVLPKGSIFFRKNKIKIIIDKPILTSGMKIDDKQKLIDDCRSIISKNLLKERR